MKFNNMIRLSGNVMKLSNIIRLNNTIRLRNVIRLDNIIRLNNTIRLKAGQQGEDLRLLGYYRKIIIVNKWLPFETAIRQKNKILFRNWERLYIYNINGHIITVYSIKRFGTRITLYKKVDLANSFGYGRILLHTNQALE